MLHSGDDLDYAAPELTIVIHGRGMEMDLRVLGMIWGSGNRV